MPSSHAPSPAAPAATPSKIDAPLLPPVARVDDQLCFALYGALQAMTRTYKPLLEPHGLTYPQYLVMLVLWEVGEASVREIGARLNLDSGTLTPLLKRLEAAGYVIRRRSSADERVVLVTPTTRGASLQRDLADVMRCIGIASGLPVGDLVSLRERLKTLKRNLDEAP